jgi:hypothetical protein
MKFVKYFLFDATLKAYSDNQTEIYLLEQVDVADDAESRVAHVLVLDVHGAVLRGAERGAADVAPERLLALLDHVVAGELESILRISFGRNFRPKCYEISAEIIPFNRDTDFKLQQKTALCYPQRCNFLQRWRCNSRS